MSWLKDYLSFTKRERNAFIALMVIIAGFIFLPDLFRPKKMAATVSASVKQHLPVSKERSDSASGYQDWESGFSASPREIRLFEFDPNTLNEAGYITLGLPERTARTIINYRNKGGVFRKPDDLRKIYSLKKEDADRIIPYASIKRGDSYASPFYDNDQSRQTEPITAEVKLFEFDPNTLDEQGFIKLGLPEKTARTIINYRNKGGKFRKQDDLRKIYSLSKADADRIIPFVRIESGNTADDPGETRTYQKQFNIIDINTATAEEWKTLPGIGEILSARIVKFRQSIGGFSSIEQVAKTYGLRDSTFQLIKPYLKYTAAPKDPEKP